MGMNKKAVGLSVIVATFIYLFVDNPIGINIEDTVLCKKETQFQYSIYSCNDSITELFQEHGVDKHAEYIFGKDYFLISDSEVERLSFRRVDRIWVWNWGQDIIRIKTSMQHDGKLYVYRIPSRFILEEFSR